MSGKGKRTRERFGWGQVNVPMKRDVELGGSRALKFYREGGTNCIGGGQKWKRKKCKSAQGGENLGIKKGGSTPKTNENYSKKKLL